MTRALLYSEGVTANPWGVKLLSIVDISERLKISRQTAYKWMGPHGEDRKPLLATTGGQMIGRTFYRWFDPEYVDEVFAALPKGWGRGKQRVSPELAEKLKGITAKWQKKAKH
jgi:hypothetical protein